MGIQKVSLPITGMASQTCASRVELALNRVDATTQVEVDLSAQIAHVGYDDAQIDVMDLLEAVEESGYGVQLERIVLPVGGMTCASCAAHVEGALLEVPGVVHVNVSLARQQAALTQVAQTAGSPEFKQAVESSGYEFLLSAPHDLNGELNHTG